MTTDTAWLWTYFAEGDGDTMSLDIIWNSYEHTRECRKFRQPGFTVLVVDGCDGIIVDDDAGRLVATFTRV
jgi:hypothetical protein